MRFPDVRRLMLIGLGSPFLEIYVTKKVKAQQNAEAAAQKGAREQGEGQTFTGDLP